MMILEVLICVLILFEHTSSVTPNFSKYSSNLNQAARRVVYNKDLTTTLLAG